MGDWAMKCFSLLAAYLALFAFPIELLAESDSLETKIGNAIVAKEQKDAPHGTHASRIEVKSIVVGRKKDMTGLGGDIEYPVKATTTWHCADGRSATRTDYRYIVREDRGNYGRLASGTGRYHQV